MIIIVDDQSLLSVCEEFNLVEVPQITWSRQKPLLAIYTKSQKNSHLQSLLIPSQPFIIYLSRGTIGPTLPPSLLYICLAPALRLDLICYIYQIIFAPLLTSCTYTPIFLTPLVTIFTISSVVRIMGEPSSSSSASYIHMVRVRPRVSSTYSFHFFIFSYFHHSWLLTCVCI